MGMGLYREATVRLGRSSRARRALLFRVPRDQSTADSSLRLALIATRTGAEFAHRGRRSKGMSEPSALPHEPCPLGGSSPGYEAPGRSSRPPTLSATRSPRGFPWRASRIDVRGLRHGLSSRATIGPENVDRLCWAIAMNLSAFSYRVGVTRSTGSAARLDPRLSLDHRALRERHVAAHRQPPRTY